MLTYEGPANMAFKQNRPREDILRVHRHDYHYVKQATAVNRTGATMGWTLYIYRM